MVMSSNCETWGQMPTERRAHTSIGWAGLGPAEGASGAEIRARAPRRDRQRRVTPHSSSRPPAQLDHRLTHSHRNSHYDCTLNSSSWMSFPQFLGSFSAHLPRSTASQANLTPHLPTGGPTLQDEADELDKEEADWYDHLHEITSFGYNTLIPLGKLHTHDDDQDVSPDREQPALLPDH